MPKLEFFWDVGSPYTYLASTQLAALGERTGATIVTRPFLVGGVFKAVGNHMPASIPPKASYLGADLARWREHLGVQLLIPVAEVVFPINSLTTMRAACAVEDQDATRFMHTVMAGYWQQGIDVGEKTQLHGVLADAGFDADALIAATSDQAIKDKLRANTEEAVARGAFGAPTWFVGDQHFFGNDRLHFVEKALRSKPTVS